MKKILTAFAILAFFSISFTACKKEKDKAKTASEQIIGTWRIDNVVYNEHTDGADNINTTNITPNDTYEFRKDGTVNATVNGESDSSTYSIAQENKLTITDDETYDIKSLDDHTLVLYYKDVYGSDYEEATITFKR